MQTKCVKTDICLNNLLSCCWQTRATCCITTNGKILKQTRDHNHAPFVGDIARIDIAYSCTKFDDFRFSHSSDMIGAPKFCIGSHDFTMPLSRTVRAHTTYYWNLLENMRLSCTVFEMLSLIFQKLNMSRDSPRPFPGQFVVLRLGLAMMNMYTKFEV